jgi:hypothetical protein
MKYLKLCICGQLRLSKKHGDATPNTIMVLAAHQQIKGIIIASIKGGIPNREAIMDHQTAQKRN